MFYTGPFAFHATISLVHCMMVGIECDVCISEGPGSNRWMAFFEDS